MFTTKHCWNCVCLCVCVCIAHPPTSHNMVAPSGLRGCAPAWPPSTHTLASGRIVRTQVGPVGSALRWYCDRVVSFTSDMGSESHTESGRTDGQRQGGGGGQLPLLPPLCPLGLRLPKPMDCTGFSRASTKQGDDLWKSTLPRFGL